MWRNYFFIFLPWIPCGLRNLDIEEEELNYTPCPLRDNAHIEDVLINGIMLPKKTKVFNAKSKISTEETYPWNLLKEKKKTSMS